MGDVRNNNIWGDFHCLSRLINDKEYNTCECCKFWDFDVTSDSVQFLCLNKNSKQYKRLTKYNFSCESCSYE